MLHKISFFGNPFYIQGLIWTIVSGIYSLGWSDLYPKISVNLSTFFFIVIIIYFLLGYICQRRKYFYFVPINISIKQQIKISWWLRILYTLLLIEIIFTSCPLWSYLTTGETDYTEFGLPFIHVIIVAGFTIICWFSFHGLLCSKNKAQKKRLCKFIILSLIPFIIIFNRGGLITIILGMSFIYLMSIRVTLKQILYSIVGALGIFWFFGYLGDIRVDLKPDQHLILELGGASDNFKYSSIPPEFFWAYIYITSPLGNVQNNINQTKEVEPTLKDFGEMILFDFTPRIFSKRIASILDIEEKKSSLVVPQLNVCTVYKNSYNYLGWIGLVLMFCFSIFFVFITLGLANRKSPLYDTLLVSVNVIVAMNLFDNMFTFMGLVPIPFFLLLLSQKYRFLGK